MPSMNGYSVFDASFGRKTTDAVFQICILNDFVNNVTVHEKFYSNLSSEILYVISILTEL